MEVLKLLTVNLDVLGAIQNAYGGREAFNVHLTSPHGEQSPFPDQLKGMWFSLKQKFFEPPEDQDFIPKLSYEGEEIGRVSTTLVDVYEKGKDKVAQHFGRKLFNTFHILPVNHELHGEVEEEQKHLIEPDHNPYIPTVKKKIKHNIFL